MDAAIAVLSGAVGGALVAQIATFGRESFEARVKRRGYARMLHEDFLRQQSTVARAFYRSTHHQPAWWTAAEFLEPMTQQEMLGDLLGGLRGRRYVAVASALGWMAYLQRARDEGQPARSKEELVEAYVRLGTARYALGRLGGMKYREHDHAQMAGGSTARARELALAKRAAKAKLKKLRTGDVPAERPTASI